MTELLIALLHLIIITLLVQIDDSLAIFAARPQVIPFTLCCFAGFQKIRRGV